MNPNPHNPPRSFIPNKPSIEKVFAQGLAYLAHTKGTASAEQVAAWIRDRSGGDPYMDAPIFHELGAAIKSGAEFASGLSVVSSPSDIPLGIPVMPGTSEGNTTIRYTVVVNTYNTDGDLLYGQTTFVYSDSPLSPDNVEQLALESVSNNQATSPPPPVRGVETTVGASNAQVIAAVVVNK